MESSRIKTVVIIILLLVNAAFLVVALTLSGNTQTIDAKAREDMAGILKKNGISLRLGAEFPAVKPGAAEIARDRQAEDRLAQALLGGVEAQDKGGNIYLYEKSGDEYARFRGNGEFEIALLDGPEAGDSAEKAAKSLLRDLKFEADTENPTVTVSGEETDVAFDCTYGGYRVYNCAVTFSYRDGRLAGISGRRVTGAGGTVKTGAGVYTVLMRFLETIKTKGYVCNEILGVSAGYSMATSVSGVNSLEPTWRISTDTGDYYVSGAL